AAVKSLTIVGAGSATTIDAGGGSPPGSHGISNRVLMIDSGSTVTLRQLAVKGGRAPSGIYADGADGGGIYNSGTLTLDHATVSHNAAGVGGYLVSGNGANGGSGDGIFNRGTLTLTDA